MTGLARGRARRNLTVALFAKRCLWLAAGFLFVAVSAFMFMRLVPDVGFPSPFLIFAFA